MLTSGENSNRSPDAAVAQPGLRGRGRGRGRGKAEAKPIVTSVQSPGAVAACFVTAWFNPFVDVPIVAKFALSMTAVSPSSYGGLLSSRSRNARSTKIRLSSLDVSFAKRTSWRARELRRTETF